MARSLPTDRTAQGLLDDPGLPQEMVVTSVIVIAAGLNEDGQFDLVFRCDSDSPPWLHTGMLGAVLDELGYNPLNAAINLDEDEDDD